MWTVVLALFAHFFKGREPERERTFLAIKPDGVQRGLMGQIVQRFEANGLKLVAMKFIKPPVALLQKHYIDLKDKPFYGGLVHFMNSGPVLAMVWEGIGVVRTCRRILGETNPADSAPGTIRGDLCVDIGRNVVHGSDSDESASKEIALWFRPEELVTWYSNADAWVSPSNIIHPNTTNL